MNRKPEPCISTMLHPPLTTDGSPSSSRAPLSLPDMACPEPFQRGNVLWSLMAACLFCLLFVHASSAGTGLPGPQPEKDPPPGQTESALPAPSVEGGSGFLLTEGDGLSIGIGGYVSDSPYKNYDLEWMPLPLVYYEGEYVYLRGTAAGLKLVNRKHVEVSVFAGYDDTSFDASSTSHKALGRLRDRHAGIELGAEARVLTPAGMLFANAAGDILGHSNGMRGTMGWSNSWEHGAFELAPSAGMHWKDSKYNDYYYGVSGGESRKSGLATYDAGADVSPFVGLTLSYDITDSWGVFCSGEVVFLSNTVRDSPMVDASRVHSAMFGLMYGF